MFDGLMASYSYKGFGTQEGLHMYCTILHILLSHILLLNYLIAILSQAYSDMLDKGKFLYQVYLYQYCERYMVALRNKAYGQLVIHPAPICTLNFPIVLLSLVSKVLPSWVLVSVSNAFALFMYWLENFVGLLFFFCYECALAPLVYLKNILTVAWATQGMFLTVGYTMLWIWTGPVFLLFFVLRDVRCMFSILAMTSGCRANFGIKDEILDEDADENEEIRLYNEARAVCMVEYFKIRKSLRSKENANEEDGDETPVWEDRVLAQLDEDNELYEKHKDEFISKASTLTDLWRKTQSARRKAEDDENRKDTLKKEDKKEESTEEERKKKEELQKRKDEMGKSKGGQIKKSFINREGGQTERIVGVFVDQVVEVGANGGDEAAEGEEDVKEEKPDEGEDDLSYAPTPEQARIVASFFDCFKQSTEGSSSSDSVNLVLLMRAVPTKVHQQNVAEKRKFKFIVLEDAVIAYANKEDVTSFDYYDKKNKKRVSDVKALVAQQTANLETIEQNLSTVDGKLESAEQVLVAYQAVAEQWADEKKEAAKGRIGAEVEDQRRAGASEKDASKRSKAAKQNQKKGKAGK